MVSVSGMVSAVDCTHAAEIECLQSRKPRHCEHKTLLYSHASFIQRIMVNPQARQAGKDIRKIVDEVPIVNCIVRQVHVGDGWSELETLIVVWTI